MAAMLEKRAGNGGGLDGGWTFEVKAPAENDVGLRVVRLSLDRQSILIESGVGHHACGPRPII